MDFKDKVTEISKKAGKVATDTYNTVADKSGKIFEEAKSKIAILDMEKEISNIYEQIGISMYAKYQNGDKLDKELVKECKKIDKLNKDIADLNTKILYNKGLRICDKCGETISKDALFCPSCGEKLKAVRIKKTVKKENKQEKVEIPKERVCPQCGKIEPPESRFCTKCGYKF